MVHFEADRKTGIVHGKIKGKVSAEEIDKVAAKMDDFTKAQGGKLHGILLEIQHFDGYADMNAFMEDYKFIKAHQQAMGKIAIVGHKQWQQWLIELFKPFVKSEQKYFDQSELEEAKKWVEE